MHLLHCSMNLIYSSKIDHFVHSISYGVIYEGPTQYSVYIPYPMVSHI